MSIELIDLWDRVQAVCSCFSARDMWVWIPGRYSGFFIESGWDTIKSRSVQVHWASLLWGGRNVPKHSFYAWLAIKDQLGTRGRLRRWDSSGSLLYHTKNVPQLPPQTLSNTLMTNPTQLNPPIPNLMRASHNLNDLRPNIPPKRIRKE